jgi:alpha-ketoglutarate-dependent 2,4-dichlorophenoxyacetate dioxygenase
MTLTVQAVTPGFVAEIGDIDLSRPLTPGDSEAVLDAFATYAVLVFPDQTLSDDEHLAFAKLFGPLEQSVGVYRTDTKLRLREEIADVSNLDGDNEIWGEDSRLRRHELGNRLWHTDSSFKYLPAKASLLYARAIPPVGGHTEYADLRAAYDALSADMKEKIDGLVALHSIMTSRAKIGFTDFLDEERKRFVPVPQAVCRTIPETDRKTLYVASHMGRIAGMSEEDSSLLAKELIEHATQRQFVYVHRWRVHDLVIWDNRCTMHRGSAFDDLRWRRDMRRATVSDIANSAEQEGLNIDAA